MIYMTAGKLDSRYPFEIARSPALEGIEPDDNVM
jgi:hypothetical protein